MNIRVKATLGAALAGLLAVTAACSGGGGDGGEQPLRVASHVDASSLDPIRGNSGWDHMLIYPVYDTLVTWDENFEAAPGLAESWELVSPTALQLNLREGVTFHDGTPFDAEAVKFNLARVKGEDSNIAIDIASVASVDVVDESTVMLNLSQPDASLLMVLADRAGMMVSPTAAEKNDNDLSTNPVGTGGWSFVAWDRGSSIQYERYEDYWDAEAVRAPKLTFKILEDPKTRVTALQSDQVDIANELSASDADTVEGNDNLKLSESARFAFSEIYIDRGSAEFSNPDVRRAVNLSIDRQAIADAAFFGRATPASSAMPQDYWATPPKDVVYEYDPEEALSLLKGAGAEGLEFDVNINNDSQTVRIAEIMKQQMEKAGITMNLIPTELTQGTSEFFDDRLYPAYLSVWTGRPDPAMTYRSQFAEKGYFNTSHEPVPGLEEILAASDDAVTTEERAVFFQDAARAVYDDSSMMPIAHYSALVGMSTDVDGFENNLLGKPKFVGVTVSA